VKQPVKVLFTTLRALIYMTAFILLWRWLALEARDFDRQIQITLPDWIRLLAVPIFAIGGAIVLSCVAIFVARGRGTPAPFDPPREFVATGPYKLVRNPMYIGGLLLLIGFGLWQRSVSMLLFCCLAAFLVHIFVLLVEEPNLEQRFGLSYRTYKQSVNRWLPSRPERTSR
jgi:protein-S-isoprenylcysteine O-methyltransferase Ste14